jgi:hypothetical protein
MGTAKRPDVDWERVEIQYRAGLMSSREIGLAHGITHVAVNKRAKVHGWQRDLNAKIKAKADALVSARMVTDVVTAAKKAVTEEAIIEAGAEAIARVKTAHRKDIERYRNICNRLAGELEATTDPEMVDLFERLAYLLKDPDKADEEETAAVAAKRQREFRKLLSMGDRIANIKALSDALKTLVTLERESYGLDVEAPEKPEEVGSMTEFWPELPRDEPIVIPSHA